MMMMMMMMMIIFYAFVKFYFSHCTPRVRILFVEKRRSKFFAFRKAMQSGKFSLSYRVFSHDVTAAILVSQNNETAAMLVSQTSPVGVEVFSHVNAFFCSNKFAWMLTT